MIGALEVSDDSLNLSYLIGVKMKCSRCRLDKPIEEFRVRKNSNSGYTSACKACLKLYERNHYKKNTLIERIRKINNKNINQKRYWASSSISSHRSRKLKINISINELEQLAIQTTHCYYCGRKLDYSFGKKKNSKSNSPTLDRINGENELTINNVRIICHSCNSTKRDRTHIQFINYCKMISNKF